MKRLTKRLSFWIKGQTLLRHSIPSMGYVAVGVFILLLGFPSAYGASYPAVSGEAGKDGNAKAGEIEGPRSGKSTPTAAESSPPSDGHRSRFWRHSFGLGAGHTILFGEWGDLYDDNLSYQLFYSYAASDIFAFVMNLGMSRHNGNNGDELNLKYIEPDVRVNFVYFDKIVLYGFGGFGLYPIQQKVGGVSPVEASTLNFGLNAGFGLDLKIDEHFSFGPGMGLRSIFVKNDSGAKSSGYPGGVNVGGELMRLYVQIAVSL